MTQLSEIFAINVFNDEVMQRMLMPETYEAFKNTVKNNLPLGKEIADKIAKAMMDWATSGCRKPCGPLHQGQ